MIASANEVHTMSDAKAAAIEAEKKPQTKNLLKLAKGLKRTKSLVKLAGGSALAIGAIVVALPVLGTVMLLSLAVGAIAFIATTLFSVNFVQQKTGLKVDLMRFVKSAEAMTGKVKDVNIESK
jgi:hypothetical protein